MSIGGERRNPVEFTGLRFLLQVVVLAPCGFAKTQADTFSRMTHRRTVVRTLTRRMVITMTTSRITFRREVARDWPILAGDSDVPAAVGVASVGVRRRADESVASAAVVAATTLGAALGEIMPPEQGKLWLLALGQPTSRTNRVAAYHAERDKLWAALEKPGVALPRGSRTEFEVAYSDDVLRFGGVIEFMTAEFSVALEVTRRENAVCVGRINMLGGFDWERFVSSLDSLPKDSVVLLRAVVRQIADGLFVARSFGQFDDALVISEVFAENDTINRLEAIIGLTV